MRKLVSISLLVLFLFNLVGYRFVFDAMQQQADKVLEAKLDKQQYNKAELVTISVPLSMPYLTNWDDFERVDGEITLNGKIYHYVERKVQNGEMILKCIPDHAKMNLESAKNNIAKSSADSQSNSEKKSTATFKQHISDYDDAIVQNSFGNSFVASVQYNLAQTYHLSLGVVNLPFHPPCL